MILVYEPGLNILSSLSISFLTIWNWKVEIPTGVSMGLAE